MLKVKINKTVNGIANISVGSNDTRATNHDCSKNSRQANGLRGIKINVSSAIAKNPPTDPIGVAAAVDNTFFRCRFKRPSRHVDIGASTAAGVGSSAATASDE